MHRCQPGRNNNVKLTDGMPVHFETRMSQKAISDISLYVRPGHFPSTPTANLVERRFELTHDSPKK